MMKKNRMCLLLAALLTLCLFCAPAQAETGAAVTAAETNLYSAPQESAQVLMRYFVGTRVEVIREADAQFVQVNVGEQGGSLMGYMKAADLVFGEKAIRSIQPVEIVYRAQKPWTLYAHCDVSTGVVLDGETSYVNAMGEMGEWIHARVRAGDQEHTGFVSKSEAGLHEGLRMSGKLSYVRTELLEGEITQDALIEYAKARIVEDGQIANGTKDEPVTRQMLDDCRAHVQVLYYFDEKTQLVAQVTFFYEDRTWEDGMPFICAFCDMGISGEDVLWYGFGNG